MPKIQLKTARTTQEDPVAAAEDLLSQIGGATPKLVTLFAADDRDQRPINEAVYSRLPKGTRLVGASGSGQIDSRGIFQKGIVLGAWTGDFEVGIGLGKGLTLDALGAGTAAIDQAARELGVRVEDLDPRRHVGMVIDDGPKLKKEELLLGMLDKNQGLALVGGGSSGEGFDPSQMKPGIVHVDGQVADDAALVALFSTEAPFAALRTHWYEPIGIKVKITKVDDTNTRALEIDGKPAAPRYAELLGVSVPDLEYGKPTGFSANPTALKVGREYFVRSPAVALPDGSVLFMNLLHEGTELELMKTGDMVEHTRRFFLEEMTKRVPSPTAAVLFNCSARAFLSMLAGKLGEISQAFTLAPPSVGFNCCFETYGGFHINTTLTALVFGER
jgi:hypothetical protein